MRIINHITLHIHYCWLTLFPFLLPGSTKEKKIRHINPLLQHNHISKLLTLKSDAQYLLKTFRRKFRFEETLNKVSKQHRQQERKIASQLVRSKVKYICI